MTNPNLQYNILKLNKYQKENAQNSPILETINAQKSYQEIKNRTVYLSQIDFNVWINWEIIWHYWKGFYTEKLYRIE